MKKIIKVMIKKLYFLYNYLPFNNLYEIRGGVKIYNNGKILKGCKFRCHGTGNKIILKDSGFIRNSMFFIKGNNNVIEIDSGGGITNAHFWIEDSNNRIVIGKNTNLCGSIHLACIEGTEIHIGDDCLFSSDIVFRTGDSHSLLDLQGNRINPSSDIVIGNHVWIGHRVTINKGVNISKDNMIGTGAIVTKSFNEQGTVIAGVPAKIVKRDIQWCAERV